MSYSTQMFRPDAAQPVNDLLGNATQYLQRITPNLKRANGWSHTKFQYSEHRRFKQQNTGENEQDRTAMEIMCNVLRMRSTTRKRSPAYRGCSVNTNARLRPALACITTTSALSRLFLRLQNATSFQLPYNRKNQPSMNSKKENPWNGWLIRVLWFSTYLLNCLFIPHVDSHVKSDSEVRSTTQNLENKSEL